MVLTKYVFIKISNKIPLAWFHILIPSQEKLMFELKTRSHLHMYRHNHYYNEENENRQQKISESERTIIEKKRNNFKKNHKYKRFLFPSQRQIQELGAPTYPQRFMLLNQKIDVDEIVDFVKFLANFYSTLYGLDDIPIEV